MERQRPDAPSRSQSYQSYTGQQTPLYAVDQQIPAIPQNQGAYEGLQPSGGPVQYVPTEFHNPQQYGQMAASETPGLSDYYIPLASSATPTPQHDQFPSYYAPLPYDYDYQQDPYQNTVPSTRASISEPGATPTAMQLSPDPSLARASTSPGPMNPVRVVTSRPKPQCWEHGCNGREFSTFSNLLRHQRERAGTAAKTECPHCGTVFTRSTARNSHLSQGKCKSKQDSPE